MLISIITNPWYVNLFFIIFSFITNKKFKNNKVCIILNNLLSIYTTILFAYMFGTKMICNKQYGYIILLPIYIFSIYITLKGLITNIKSKN